MDKSANAQLAHWFQASGFTKPELARLVGDRAAAQGERQINPDESRVRRWLAGEVPRNPVPEILAELFSQRLGIALTPADLGLPGPDRPVLRSGLDLPWHPGTTTTAIDHLTRSSLMLSRSRPGDAAEVHQGVALLQPLQAWPYQAPGPLAPSPLPASGRVGMSEVTQIRQVTQMFREADNRLGGGLSRQAVVAQMQQVNALLDTCTYTEETGRALFCAVADLGSVAGWMSFDAGMHGTAQRIFVTALHAAVEGGDKALGAHILQCMARQMSHLGHVKDALDLVALAQYGARHQASQGTKAMLAALESRFRAITGDLSDSDMAAGAAETAFDRTRLTEEPPYMAFFDRAELCATLGVAHQIAARHSDGRERYRRAHLAISMITEARGHRPPDRVRSLAFDRIGLARTHLAVGELDGACEETRLALTIASTLSSVRLGDRLVELREETTPYAAEPGIRELREAVDAALASDPA